MEAIESIDLNDQCFPIMHNLCYDGIIDYNCNSFNTLSIESPYYNYEEFNNKVINAKEFSIIHINCRSLGANFLKIKNLPESLHHSFYVIALSETWLNDNNSHILHLEGFHFICHNTSKKRG